MMAMTIGVHIPACVRVIVPTSADLYDLEIEFSTLGAAAPFVASAKAVKQRQQSV